MLDSAAEDTRQADCVLIASRLRVACPSAAPHAGPRKGGHGGMFRRRVLAGFALSLALLAPAAAHAQGTITFWDAVGPALSLTCTTGSYDVWVAADRTA